MVFIFFLNTLEHVRGYKLVWLSQDSGGNQQFYLQNFQHSIILRNKIICLLSRYLFCLPTFKKLERRIKIIAIKRAMHAQSEFVLFLGDKRFFLPWQRTILA